MGGFSGFGDLFDGLGGGALDGVGNAALPGGGEVGFQVDVFDAQGEQFGDAQA